MGTEGLPGWGLTHRCPDGSSQTLMTGSAPAGSAVSAETKGHLTDPLSEALPGRRAQRSEGCGQVDALLSLLVLPLPGCGMPADGEDSQAAGLWIGRDHIA